MINLTSEVRFISSGRQLSSAIIKAITQSKECVRTEIFPGESISPENVTSASKNRFRRASILRLFHRHDDPSVSQEYNENWVNNLYSAAKKTASPHLIRSLLPKTEEAQTATNRTFAIALRADALLILNFLWAEGVVLLPASLKLPTTLNTNTGSQTFEYAANFYPETLRLVRAPFISNIGSADPDITSILQESALKNFNWYAWRFVRATSWRSIEDIDLEDVTEYISFSNNKKNATGLPNYPIAPKSIVMCFKHEFPDRCSFESNDPRLKNARRQATQSALEKGSYYTSVEMTEHIDQWLYFQRKFVREKRIKGMKSWQKVEQSFGILNAFLFDEIPLKASKADVPKPQEFSRKHLEGNRQIPSFNEYLMSGRQPSTVKQHLYSIHAFFRYLEKNSNTYEALKGFVDPIDEIDYPIVARNHSTSKAVFSSDHFAPLLQYCYAIEAFGWHLLQSIQEGVLAITHYTNSQPKLYDTEALGFVPIVFLRGSS